MCTWSYTERQTNITESIISLSETTIMINIIIVEFNYNSKVE